MLVLLVRVTVHSSTTARWCIEIIIGKLVKRCTYVCVYVKSYNAVSMSWHSGTLTKSDVSASLWCTCGKGQHLIHTHEFNCFKLKTLLHKLLLRANIFCHIIYYAACIWYEGLLRKYWNHLFQAAWTSCSYQRCCHQDWSWDPKRKVGSMLSMCIGHWKTVELENVWVGGLET